ncbi:MAG: hypothetical protein PHN88_14785 [Ignavibacteria bacterium]|nr:hypothetical protein [Ignavibacteria bacterium]
MNFKNSTFRNVSSVASIEFTDEEKKIALKTDAAKIVSIIRKGFENMFECASKIAHAYVSAVKGRPELDAEIKAQAPEFPSSIWYDLDLIGRDLMAAQLLIGYTNAKPFLRRLPPTEQEQIISSPVEVLLMKAPGEWDTLKVDVKNLKPEQCKQVFDYNHVRSANEQRAYIEQEASSRVVNRARNGGRGYNVSPDGYLIVSKDTKISYEELKIQMKKIEAIRGGK